MYRHGLTEQVTRGFQMIDVALAYQATDLGAEAARVYTIAIRCADASGNTAAKSATVSVPK